MTPVLVQVLPRLSILVLSVLLILLVPVAAWALETIGRACSKWRRQHQTRLARILAQHDAAERGRFADAVLRCPRCEVVRTEGGTDRISCPLHADPVSAELEREAAS